MPEEYKTYLVTGATSGIGLAAARHFLTNGYRVIITGRSKEKLDFTHKELTKNTPNGNMLLPILCNIGKMDHIHRMANQLKGKNIYLDALILNAGIFLRGTFEESDEELFDSTFNINVKGQFFTIQKLLPVLKNPSSIVMISSIAIHKAFLQSSIYGASKAAIEGFATVLNVELADRGIRINSIRPSITMTEIQKKAGMNDNEIAGLIKTMEATALGRTLNVDDIVPAIAFMASSDSIGLRNSHLIIDGGHCL
ncbi:SDR family NAD(P)-dependent oxidoreductase [Microbulbifer sp. SSSA007]|uniref:SDR family NAD(P)-dependent oxidoreductase n=1 Tax=Microbulbifer sp. SSSA007 TaxID=3243379 RepID=UPI0040396484